VRLSFELDSDATVDELTTLGRLTERYCVVYQALARSPALSTSIVRSGEAPVPTS